MEKAHKILEEKAVRITPMRQLLLEYFLQNNGTFGLIELENAFPKSDRITTVSYTHLTLPTKA